MGISYMHVLKMDRNLPDLHIGIKDWPEEMLNLKNIFPYIHRVLHKIPEQYSNGKYIAVS
jgi:hypothetical protein